MLEPSSKKDPIPITRKALYQFEFFSVVKKELVPEHFDSPFYQSVLLLVTPRFIESHRIATFNVSQKIDTTITERTKYSQNLIRGISVNKKVLSQLGIGGHAEFSDSTHSSHVSTRTQNSSNNNTIERYMSEYTLNNELYTKGIPFANVMDKKAKIVLVPFGFTRKLIHEHLCEAKITLENGGVTTFDNGFTSSLIGRLIGGCNHGGEVVQEDINNTIPPVEFLQKINNVITLIEENYLLKDGKSVCEFDKISMEMIDNVAKQSVMVPHIVPSYGVSPVVNSRDVPFENNPYKRFDILTKKYPMKNIESTKKDIVRLSAYIKPEQLGTEESVSKLANSMAEYYGKSGFIQSVDYNVEHYTNTDFAIRLDFYVLNMDVS